MNLKINAMVAVVIPEEGKDSPIAVTQGLEKFLNEKVFVPLKKKEGIDVHITMNLNDMRVGYPPMPKVKPPKKDDA